MAGRGPQSFKKRQKEQQRKEKQAEKMAKRLERKRHGSSSLTEEVELSEAGQPEVSQPDAVPSETDQRQ